MHFDPLAQSVPATVLQCRWRHDELHPASAGQPIEGSRVAERFMPNKARSVVKQFCRKRSLSSSVLQNALKTRARRPLKWNGST